LGQNQAESSPRYASRQGASFYYVAPAIDGEEVGHAVDDCRQHSDTGRSTRTSAAREFCLPTRQQLQVATERVYRFRPAGTAMVAIKYDRVATTKRLLEARRDEDNDEDDEAELFVEDAMCREVSSCTCMFSLARLLPCRHVLFVCKASSRLPVIPFKSIADRWNLHALRH
jgi:hypothetical protein